VPGHFSDLLTWKGIFAFWMVPCVVSNKGKQEMLILKLELPKAFR